MGKLINATEFFKSQFKNQCNYLGVRSQGSGVRGVDYHKFIPPDSGHKFVPLLGELKMDFFLLMAITTLEKVLGGVHLGRPNFGDK
jgi:hypothetical protein